MGAAEVRPVPAPRPVPCVRATRSQFFPALVPVPRVGAAGVRPVLAPSPSPSFSHSHSRSRALRSLSQNVVHPLGVQESPPSSSLCKLGVLLRSCLPQTATYDNFNVLTETCRITDVALGVFAVAGTSTPGKTALNVFHSGIIFLTAE